MKSFAFVFASVILSLVSANPTSHPDYKTVDLVWEGEVIPGGEIHTFHGTVDSIYDEILNINPNYGQEKFDKNEDSYVSDHQLEKRDSINCNPGGDMATYRDLKGVISKLKGMGNARCTAASGPRVCTRVGCNYGSYVTFCNDNSNPITRNCVELGDMAQRIVDSCIARNSGVVIGQYFNSDFNFNALVKGGGKC
ncbi:secreted protein [Melampsora americana]|nr:secreted protein [Melampsora americana]